jgi:phosphomannomutase
MDVKMENPMSAPKIFKAYDIRGVYGEELDEGIAYLVGRAVATKLIIQKPSTGRIRKVLVGRDMRTSSVPLRDALVKGIRDQGIDVVDVGFVSTPLFYWATQKYEAGVMVTASHNPAKYNGFKICKDGAFPVGEISGMKEIEACVLNQDFAPSEGEGTYREEHVLDEYIQFCLSFLKTEKPFKIVIDAGNGMGGYIYSELMKHVPKNIHIIPMYFEPDGTFPNHEANPLKPETCKELQERVILENADLGVALDGDEDRVFFIDNTGRYLESDYPSALIAEQVLSEKSGSKILYGINQSRIVPDTIKKFGGIPVLNRVGHAFYKVSMAEQKAAWGAEHSGHYFNPEQQNTENTVIIFFRLLNLLAKEEKSFAELVNPLRRYAKISETNFDVADPKASVAKLQQEYAHQKAEVTTIDGLRMDFADWWFCVRPSNTEPVLRLNMEAKDEHMLKQKLEELSHKIGGKLHH